MISVNISPSSVFVGASMYSIISIFQRHTPFVQLAHAVLAESADSETSFY